jgi:hypothetical protein
MHFAKNAYQNHSFCHNGSQNRAVPTHQRTPDAPRWRSRLAMDVGEGQKQTRCIDSPVRRRGGVKCSENGVIFIRKKVPLAFCTQNMAVPTHHSTPALPTPPVGALDVGEG